MNFDLFTVCILDPLEKGDSSRIGNTSGGACRTMLGREGLYSRVRLSLSIHGGLKQRLQEIHAHTSGPQYTAETTWSKTKFRIVTNC